MPEVSAAIVVVAGCALIIAGLIPSPADEASRQRVAGLGYLLTCLGSFAWIAAFARALWMT